MSDGGARQPIKAEANWPATSLDELQADLSSLNALERERGGRIQERLCELVLALPRLDEHRSRVVCCPDTTNAGPSTSPRCSRFRSRRP